MRRWFKSLGGKLPRGASARDRDQQRDEMVRRIPAPTIWMFGKTGSGKSSLVSLLTGVDRVEIGRGFRPTTQQTHQYSFPDSSLPVMHFLDTRGLGEPGYDPEQDIGQLQTQADAMIVTQRLMDFATESVIGPLRQLRRAAPRRPVLLALTCLHEAYDQPVHPPYPFADSLAPPGLGDKLERALQAQLAAFDKLVDAVVPVDITRVQDGYDPTDYGADQFINTLTELLPAACQFVLRGMSSLRGELSAWHHREATVAIHSAALMAAAAALAPVPWVDIPAVAALQTRMVYVLARIYRQPGSIQQVLEMLTAAGIGFAARLGVRELLKLIPLVGTVAGGLVGAALAYSHTYAVGRLCAWYYDRIRDGVEPTRDEIRQVFQHHWNEGKQIWHTIRQTRPQR